MIDHAAYERLKAEFRRIKENHRIAVRWTAAKLVPGSSVIRVYRKGAKKILVPALFDVDMESLNNIHSQDEYKSWFKKGLDRLDRALIEGANGTRPCPGGKWGHPAKVLILYVKELVAFRDDFFRFDLRERIIPWLYTPIDSIVINRLKKDVGIKLPFQWIKDIDSDAFFQVQDILKQAADEVEVPRILFDDI